MPVGALSRLTEEERQELQACLWETQDGKCFICLEDVDLELHRGHLDIDHIRPLSGGGPDHESNYALTHEHCNRSKQSANLHVARQLKRFEKLRDECSEGKGRGPTLDEVLGTVGGSKSCLSLRMANGRVEYSTPGAGDAAVRSAALHCDKLSHVETFFATLPLAVLYHDHRINPRAIGANLRGLLEEFHAGRPQLQVSLGWVQTSGDVAGRVHVFDGQHKAVAQILLGATELPVRVFVDPDLDLLLEANTNAGSKLRQVAFDKSVLRNLGMSLYAERLRQYQRDHGLDEESFAFSEEDLYKHFRGKSREIKRYISDAIRHGVIQDRANGLVRYIEFSGKGTQMPLSYSAVDKTFFSQFIYQEPLTSPIDQAADEGLNPRQLEQEQLVRLMTIVAEEILDERYDPDIGTYRIEKRAADGEPFPPEHLAAVRLCREEVMQAWVGLVKQVLQASFIWSRKPVFAERLLHQPLPDQAWQAVRSFLKNLQALPCWANPVLGETVFGGKPNYDYWRTVFQTGKTPQGVQVLLQPLDLTAMIQSAD